VSGDPRRDGRIGVTYVVDPVLRTSAFGLNNLPAIEIDGGGFRLSTQAELDGYIEEAMQAWRGRRCADAPIERVAVPAGTDPDLLDDLLLGRPTPSPTYAQLADIVQAGWQPPEFFEAITPGESDGILGITSPSFLPMTKALPRTSTATASSTPAWPRSTTTPRSSGPIAGRRTPSTSTRSSPTRPDTR
jgi:hypothetical protein